MPAAPAAALLLLLLLLAGPPRTEPALSELLFYDYDPTAQRDWLTLGKTDNITLLQEGWNRYRLPALLELSKSGPTDLWCFTAGKNPLIPCGGRGSAEWTTRLAAFGAMLRPHLRSGSCRGVFLGCAPESKGLLPTNIHVQVCTARA
jgi:hypothetical protein